MIIGVTGGSGFIGSRLIKKLIEKNYEVVNIDIVPPNNNKINFIKADITDLNQIKNALKNIDLLFHFAGSTVEKSRKKTYESFILDVLGTLNVLEACKVNGVNKIIFASSFYVYDGLDPKMVVNEITPLEPRNMELFGASKLMCESLIFDYSRKYQLKYVILRIGPVYGWGNCTSVIKTFIEAALSGQPIEVWGKGERKNQYTFIEDVVEGCILAMNKDNEVYNLISPEYVSIKEIAQILKDKYGFEVVFNPIQKEGPSMPYISPLKAMTELKWNYTPLEKGIEITINEAKKEKNLQ
jgi:UDP-glucose 4-epimerase